MGDPLKFNYTRDNLFSTRQGANCIGSPMPSLKTRRMILGAYRALSEAYLLTFLEEQNCQSFCGGCVSCRVTETDSFGNPPVLPKSVIRADRGDRNCERASWTDGPSRYVRRLRRHRATVG